MDIMLRRFGRGLLVGLLASLALAACNQAAPSGTPVPATATPVVSTPSPAAATPSPAGDTPEPATATPAPTAATGGLADEIPDIVAGVTLTEISVTGDDLSGIGAADALLFQAVIEAAGVDPAALEAVSATGEGLAIMGVRATGAPVQTVADELIDQILAVSPGTPSVTDVTIAGASVKRITAAAGSGAVFYVFLRDDIAFVVIAADDALGTQAIGDLL